MPNPNKLLRNILTDMKVELSEMFDRNFENKGFFGSSWKPRKNKAALGSLLNVTGTMRKSVKGAIKGTSVNYTSALPYTTLHNEGGKFVSKVRTHVRTNKNTGKTYEVKAHNRNMNMPKRQFVGDHPQVRQAIGEIIGENMREYFEELAKEIKQ